MIFLQKHMIPQDNNTCFVKNYLWMPFWNGSEIPHASALAMPTLFLKAALKCPHIHPVKPLIWGSTNANHSVGTRAPGHAIGMFPWDFPRIQERHWEYWRVIPLYPFTDPVSTIKTFFTLMVSTLRIWDLPHFFSRFLCNFLSGQQQGKFMGVLSTIY